MRNIMTVISSFLIMLCIGNVYSWSIIAAELIDNYGFTIFQSQILFGAIIAIFPLTMVIAGKLSRIVHYRFFGVISGILFFLGYGIASFSKGNFLVLLASIGLLVGMATGFGYWLALTIPVQNFPHRKGLVTGITAAGFGLGAVFMSQIAESFFIRGYSVLQLFRLIGIVYGALILGFSFLIRKAGAKDASIQERFPVLNFIKTMRFFKLFGGIFLGTFAGLMIIGSLSLIGATHEISEHTLVIGISIFALANFCGRILWGLISDRVGAVPSIIIALCFQAAAILSLALFPLNSALYLLLCFLTGFGFGGNFVLFAKETAQIFGLSNLGIVYPYVFLGYAIAGIAGPVSGGLLYDYSGSFTTGIVLASILSLVGSLIFISEIESVRKKLI